MPRVLNPRASGQTIDEAITIEAVSFDDGIEELYKFLEKRFGEQGKDWRISIPAVEKKNNELYGVLYLWFPENKRPKRWKLDPEDLLCRFLYPLYYRIKYSWKKHENYKEKIRKKWKPKKIRILFIGESPPEKGFFYQCNSQLYKAVKEAFERALKKKFQLDESFLKFLKDNGIYLEDLCERPGLHKFERKKRKEIRRKCVPFLTRKLNRLKPEKIVVTMKSIKKYVRDAVEKSKLERRKIDLVLKFPRGYPKSNESKEFVRRLSRWLRKNLRV